MPLDISSGPAGICPTGSSRWPGPGLPDPVSSGRCSGHLRDLVSSELTPGPPPRLVSGSLLSGRAAAYLGRYHAQLVLLDDLWQARGSGPRSSRRPIVPIRALDRALPRKIPPVPLMRALSVGDTETAAQLGCRHLVEEDVALLSSLCTSGADYPALLRHVLDELAENE